MQRPRILILGYGNPGRLDDGLGQAVATDLAEADLPDVTVEMDYQLQVEHSHLVAQHDLALFIDAAVEGPAPFFIRLIEPRFDRDLGSHASDPGTILALAHRLFQSKTTAFLMGIPGYRFNAFGQELSPQAEVNRRAATAFLRDCLARCDLAALAAHSCAA